MIIINGKVFRNLEEQVAYLSEMIPLFEEEDGQLIIKQGDGTEIARITLDAVSNMNVSTANDITTITITKADSTTQTFTIDMTSYLKKITGATAQDLAYVKLADGTQSSIVIDDQLRALALVKRNANGGINCSSPSYPNNAATKQYVDDAVAGASATRYNHYINVVFTDGCDETYYGLFIIQNNSDTQFNQTTFKRLFTQGQPIISGRYSIEIACNQYVRYSGAYPEIFTPCMFAYDSGVDYFINNINDYSSSLTLASISDTVKEV